MREPWQTSCRMQCKEVREIEHCFHNLSIQGTTLKLDDMIIRGLQGYELSTHVDQKTGVVESVLVLKLIVNPADVLLR